MFGYLRNVEPGLTYLRRVTKKTDLPTDPMNVNAPIEGELLTLDANDKLIRPADNAGAFTTATDKSQFYLLLNDKSRTDIQSGQGRLTVAIEKGAIFETALYALRGVGPAAITYAFDDELVAALIRDENGNLKCGYALKGATPVAAPDTAGDLVSIGTKTIARVFRAPHKSVGVSVGSSKTVLEIITL